MLQRYLILWLSMLSLLAYAWKQFHWEGDPFEASAPHLKHLITFTMFVIGGLLPPDEVKQIFRKWKMVICGTGLQFLVMPLSAYLVGKLFGFPKELFIGIILVGTVPGAMASNVLTLISRGNISYSVCLTTSATLLSPFVVPVLLYLTVQVKGIDKQAMMEESFTFLLLRIFIPVLAGYLLARKISAFEKVVQAFGTTCANLSILWIIAVVVNKCQPRIAEGAVSTDQLWLLIAALFLINFLGYTGGFWGGKLIPISSGMRRALTLEIGMQNAGLGAVLAGELFKEQPVVSLPPGLYAFVCMFTGTILAQFWSLRSLKEEVPPEGS